MIIHDLQQGTPEWGAVRFGKFTASNIHKLFMGKSTAGYNDYINQIVYERLTGHKPESFESEWMRRGTELEPEAISAYELLTFDKVVPVGFIELDEWRGCSPDGLVGQDGMIQVKCPKWSTLIDYHLTGKIPEDYLYQMQYEMYISGRKWNDFFCYHPNLKPLLKRVKLDETYSEDFEREISIAQKEVEKRIAKIKEMQ